ncbi:MAG: N-6 DNA methylase [Candidatus Thiodiazotropha sp.]
MARRNQEFQTIRSEGGLLPADLLRRVLDRSSNLAGTRPEDYGLPAGERVNEVITQSWNRLRKHWAEFRETAANLPETEAGTGLTNDRWNLPLLRELGFGLLPSSAGPEIGGRTYAISRFFGPVPVHLIGCNLSLDRRAAGQRGAAAANPHGLVQEFLNRSDAHLWALLSNGLRLRILRDNQALSRQSFLEFDLEAMMSGEVYSDFVLLWLVAHATRFAPRESDRPETCWLEKWTQEAEEQGTRALGELRRGVEQALAILGEGFTSHPKNTALRDTLRTGALSPTDLHAQLLRLVYRFIFLFVAEDRILEGQSLIHPLDDSDSARSAREHYAAHYSVARLREMAGKIKGSRHGDLWRQFQIVVRALAGENASATVREQLALPALGSFLWDPPFTPELNDAQLSNFDLLEALRHLAYTRQGKVLRPVDYKNLGAEELGSVYESLLALTPLVSGDGARFSFAELAGNERKTSGSYYTPDSLVQCLLDTTLNPVVDEAIKGKPPTQAEAAILALKVCDPAVGSGHFLVGAAHRLARHLARVRALAEGESEPSPLLYQHALRDVIGRCLYGVDMNPMAAELCRVSLWLEALEPGKPLSFLDHHIRVGNSLLGATPGLIAGGLPDDAFKPIDGDDRTICTVLKKRNKKERDGKQMDLGLSMVAEARAEYDTLASRSQVIDQAPDDSLEDIERKAEQFHRLVVSPEYRHQQTIADAWCAAFAWPKLADAPGAITTETIRRLDESTDVLDDGQRIELQRLSVQFQFFHWYLAFPEVVAQGGFDCVLGNPPWEKLQIEEQSFFAGRDESIATATAKIRKRLIKELVQNNPTLYRDWLWYRRNSLAVDALLKNSKRYPLTGSGKLNTYSLFGELALEVMKPVGRSGLVLPLGVITDQGSSRFFGYLTAKKYLGEIRGFENESFIFPSVHHSFKFCLLTMIGSREKSDLVDLVFFCRSVSDSEDLSRRYRLDTEDFVRLNPNTLTCPIFHSAAEAVLVRHVYRRVSILSVDTQTADPVLKIQRILNSTDDASDLEVIAAEPHRQHRIENVSGTTLEPVYEAKMFHQFDHRFGTYVGQTVAQANQGKLPEFAYAEHSNPELFVQPRWWVNEEIADKRSRELFSRSWVVAFRDITSPVVFRTAICTVLPHYCTTETCRCVFYMEEPRADRAIYFVTVFNSFALDFVCRTKFSGNHLSTFIVRQLPIPNVEFIRSELGKICISRPWIERRALELLYTAWDLQSFSFDINWNGPPFRWNDERRFLIRCELDAAFFHLYFPADEKGEWREARAVDGCPYDETPEHLEELQRHFSIPRDAVNYIMDTFPIVRRKDEEQHGDYRTKRQILEIYDAMQEAIRTGQPYETRLDPPPGPPLDTDGDFVSYADIADNPPPHIHLPRDVPAGADIPLQLSDLSTCFPNAPFRLRLNVGVDAEELHVRPVQTSALGPMDKVVIASSKLNRQGAWVPAAIGQLRIESRIDANDGSPYVLVSVRDNNGLAQARFSEDEWRTLTTIGIVADSASAEVTDG